MYLKNKNSSGLILLWIIVFIAGLIAIIGISIFFYFHTQNTYEKQRTELIQQIADAKVKAKIESEKLGQLQDKFLGENPQNEIVIIAFEKMQGTTADTDKLFNSPESMTPELIPKTKAALKTKLDAEQVKIKEMIDFWQKKAEAAKTQVLEASLIAQIKKDIQELSTFVKSLDSVVEALTPSNSGLTETQIDEYKAAIDQAMKEVGVLVSDVAELQNVVPPPPPTNTQDNTQDNTQNNTQTNTQTNTNTQNNTQTTTQNPITPADIQNQEQAAQQAEQTVTDLQQQLDALNQQNQNNTTDQAPPVVDNQTQDPPPPAPVYDDGSGEKPYAPPVVNYTGKPKLLQGTTQ